MKIYTLHDPDTLEVRYVGFTSKSLEDRIKKHIRCSSEEHTHKSRWIKSIIRNGKIPAILLVENVFTENWKERERFWISHFRKAGCDLTNSCDGGEGVINPSDEARLKMRAAKVGKKFSEETRSKMSSARRGVARTPETRAKIGKAARNRSPETMEKLRKASTGRIHSDETRQKLSELHKKRTPEERERIRSKISDSLKIPVVQAGTGIRFKSQSDAADYFGVSETTTGGWVKSGKLVSENKNANDVAIP